MFPARAVFLSYLLAVSLIPGGTVWEEQPEEKRTSVSQVGPWTDHVMTVIIINPLILAAILHFISMEIKARLGTSYRGDHRNMNLGSFDWRLRRGNIVCKRITCCFHLFPFRLCPSLLWWCAFPLLSDIHIFIRVTGSAATIGTKRCRSRRVQGSCTISRD
jgi:hypothetical protein